MEGMLWSSWAFLPPLEWKEEAECRKRGVSTLRNGSTKVPLPTVGNIGMCFVQNMFCSHCCFYYAGRI